MSVYTLGQAYDDLTWFHAGAMTLIAGMPVTVRGAGKYSIRVAHPETLEQSIPNPTEIEQVRSILATVFDELIENVETSHKSQIMALQTRLEIEMRQNAEPKFNALGLQITKLTIEQLQAI